MEKNVFLDEDVPKAAQLLISNTTHIATQVADSSSFNITYVGILWVLVDVESGCAGNRRVTDFFSRIAKASENEILMMLCLGLHYLDWKKLLWDDKLDCVYHSTLRAMVKYSIL